MDGNAADVAENRAAGQGARWQPGGGTILLTPGHCAITTTAQHANERPNETTGRRTSVRRARRFLVAGADWQAPPRRMGFKGTLK